MTVKELLISPRMTQLSLPFDAGTAAALSFAAGTVDACGWVDANHAASSLKTMGLTRTRRLTRSKLIVLALEAGVGGRVSTKTKTLGLGLGKGNVPMF